MIQASAVRQIRDPSKGWLVCLGWVQSGNVQTVEICCCCLQLATRGLRCWCGSAPVSIVEVLDWRAEGWLLLLCKILDHQRADL